MIQGMPPSVNRISGVLQKRRQMGRLAKYILVFWLGIFGFLAGCAKPDIQQPETPIVSTPLETPSSLDVPQEPWILVDTHAETLSLMNGERTMEVFDNIAIGSHGAGTKRWSGDGVTPLGKFRVGWINDKSRFNLFMGLDYPNLDYAEQAYRERRIDGLTYLRIRQALEMGRTPPQDSPLGGYIGIHGLGAGDPYVHNHVDWTSGCVALNNWQIRQLARWVRVGTLVEIR